MDAEDAERAQSRPGLEDLFRRRTGWDHARFADAPWISTYRVRDLLVDRFRVDRVLVAGDAAHVRRALDGGGIDAGIQDAYNLGWKVAAVVRGADDDLLDTYEDERLPVIREEFARGGDPATRANGAGGRQRRRGPDRPRRIRLPGRPRRMSRRVAGREGGLAVSYRESRLSQELGGKRVIIRAGERVPDVRLWNPVSATDIRLFDLLRGPHWTVLGLGSLTAEAVSAIARQYGSAVRADVVGGGMATPRGVSVLDRYGDAHHLLGRRGGTILVVRPDGFLGLRCGANPEIAAAYLEDLAYEIRPGL